MKDERPTHLDLFSGIGALAIAFEREGFSTSGFAEIDDFASAVLAWRWPEVRNYGDFRNVPRRYFDVVTAGVPCQPASCAGDMLGDSDSRWLWEPTIDLISDIRPAFAIFENVAALIKLQRGRAFNRILSHLHKRGFDVWWTHIPACAVGAVHKRDRLFIVAHPNIQRRTGILRCLPEICRGASPRQAAITLDSQCSIVSQLEQRLGEPAIFGADDGTPYKSHRLATIGNSVQVEVAQIFARAIYKILRPTTP